MITETRQVHTRICRIFRWTPALMVAVVFAGIIGVVLIEPVHSRFPDEGNMIINPQIAEDSAACVQAIAVVLQLGNAMLTQVSNSRFLSDCPDGCDFELQACMSGPVRSGRALGCAVKYINCERRFTVAGD